MANTDTVGLIETEPISTQCDMRVPGMSATVEGVLSDGGGFPANFDEDELIAALAAQGISVNKVLL